MRKLPNAHSLVLLGGAIRRLTRSWSLHLVLPLLIGGSLAPAVRAANPESTPVIIPAVDFENVSFEEAIDALRHYRFPNGAHVALPNLVVKVQPEALKAAGKINLQLHQVPVQTILEYISEQAGLQMRRESHAIVFYSGNDPGPMKTLVLKVPPTFRSLMEQQ